MEFLHYWHIMKRCVKLKHERGGLFAGEDLVRLGSYGSRYPFIRERLSIIV